ncbi:extracellular solute-binding protein [Actinophytocola sp.]|uniref:extracellular solute-binding protein n=1 Tax=Actinophytocola sp. TaxID=1872138 RepID=UPI00389B2DA2
MIVTVVLTSGVAILATNIDLDWRVWSILHLLTLGVMGLLSGLCVNYLPNYVKSVWKLTKEDIDLKLPELWSSLRKPLRLVGVVVTAGAVVAAGVAMRAAPTGLEPGDLVIMAASPSDRANARQMVVDQWNRLHPDNHARIETAPLNSDAQHERLVNDAKSGGRHKADLYVLDIVWMREFIQRGYIRQLDEAALSQRDLGDFVDKILKTAEDEDAKLWALPLNSDVGLIYYRTDIPGVAEPKSWEDYMGVGAKTAAGVARASDPHITAATGAELQANDEMLTISALDAMWATGGQFVDPNGQVAMNAQGTEVEFSAQDRDGIEQLAAAAKDPEVVRNKGGDTVAAAAQAFAEHQTVFMRNWPVARDAVGDKVPFKAVAPESGTVLGGQDLAVSANTDKPRAAQALAQFLTSAASETILSEVGGFVPTRQTALDNSRRPDAEEIQRALNAARLRPVTCHYVEFSKLFRQGIASAISRDGVLDADFGERLARVLRC